MGRRAVMLGVSGILLSLLLVLEQWYFIQQEETLAVAPKLHLIVKPDAVTLEDIAIAGEDGVYLKGWYAPTQNGATILLLHGYGEDRAQMLPEARFLLDRGYGVLLVDSRAHGESGGQQITYGIRESRDVSALVDWLIRRPEVDPQKIGGLGFSIGSAALASHAAVDLRLAAIILSAAPSSLYDSCFDEGGWIPWLYAKARMKAISRVLQSDAYQVNTLEAVAAIAPRPLLLIHGQLDQSVPLKHMHEVFERAGEPKRFVILPASGHGRFMATDPDLYRASVLAFFAETFHTEPFHGE